MEKDIIKLHATTILDILLIILIIADKFKHVSQSASKQ